MPREFRTVLCGTDFSEASYRALEYGLRFARNADGDLILVHVVHVPAGDLLGEKVYTLNFQESEERALKLLQDIHQSRLQCFPKCELRVEVGDPAEQLIKLARDRRVDLMITATHGRSGLAHLMMGSVAEKVIRHAPCPVLVVRLGVD